MANHTPMVVNAGKPHKNTNGLAAMLAICIQLLWLSEFIVDHVSKYSMFETC